MKVGTYHVCKIVLISSTFLMLFGSNGCNKIRDSIDKQADDVIIQPVERAKETKLMSDLGTMRRAIDAFQAQEGRFPKDLTELSQRGIISRIPSEPFGGEWLYDENTGELHSSSNQDL